MYDYLMLGGNISDDYGIAFPTPYYLRDKLK
jgi:hypothetical protein